MTAECQSCHVGVPLATLTRRVVAAGRHAYLCFACAMRVDAGWGVQPVAGYARIEYECGRCGAGYRGDEGHVCPERGEG